MWIDENTPTNNPTESPTSEAKETTPTTQSSPSTPTTNASEDGGTMQEAPRPRRRGFAAMDRDRDDRDFSRVTDALTSDLAHEGVTVFARHREIRDGHIRRVLLDGLDRIGHGRETVHAGPGILEDHREELAHIGIVIEHEHRT